MFWNTAGDLGLTFFSLLPLLPKIGSNTNISSVIENDQTYGLFKTKHNEAIFWSGRTDGVGGAEVASAFAKRNNGITLEDFIQSYMIKMPQWDLNNPISIKTWENASSAYATQASGEVRAIIGSNLRQNSLWETIELPTLLKNKNVTKITTIDPKTLKETVIFRR